MRLWFLLQSIYRVSSFVNLSAQSHSRKVRTDFLRYASRQAILNLHIKEDRDSHKENLHQKLLNEAKGEGSSGLQFAALLTRRDGLNLYGRDIVHSASDATHATLIFLDHEMEIDDNPYCVWDATLSLTPIKLSEESVDPKRTIDKKCFVAMNRFMVKDDCKSHFEKRWSERKSRLPFQPGFLGFSLLRKRKSRSKEWTLYEDKLFNYSTCTMWNSEKSWRQWRSGEGRSSHTVSKEVNTTRIPVSEWLHGPASPIFWEGDIAAGS